MEILNLKDSVEKDTFFRKLPNLTEQLPREIVLKKVFLIISSTIYFGSMWLVFEMKKFKNVCCSCSLCSLQH